MSENRTSPSRRSLLSMIGVVAGSAAMYHAMTELGYAEGSTFTGPIKLSPPPPGTSVLVLGAGIAGMVAAMELRDAGYKVQVLEYNGRPGGRNWTLYGGDTYTELGGATQHVAFDPGQYINPGPVAPALSPSRHSALCQPPGRGAGALHPGQLQRLCPFDRGLWRQAAALSPGAGRLPRPCRRASGQMHPAERARPVGEPRKTAKS